VREPGTYGHQGEGILEGFVVSRALWPGCEAGARRRARRRREIFAHLNARLGLHAGFGESVSKVSLEVLEDERIDGLQFLEPALLELYEIDRRAVLI